MGYRRKCNQRTGWLLAALLLLAGSGAAAHEPQRNILAEATAFMEAAAAEAHGAGFEVSVSAGRLDDRLRLRACEEGLEAFNAPGTRTAGNTTVGVRCHGPVSWTLYVPVQIEVRGEVVVLGQPLPRGSVLQPSQLRLERQDVGGLSNGYLGDLEEARDMVLRRALQAGTVLTPQMVEPPRLIERGQRVLLVAETGTVAVRVQAEAMGNGALGERVRVRNLSSQEIVEGRVLSHGVVGVSM
ncbi:MAG: flagella basal body P-ring formation protein FlgA [Thioalkalivibrio sp.]|nr:MAG: flagella basal body P-ring formation protein FlgA [Thioalkalivibrio sp.]